MKDLPLNMNLSCIISLRVYDAYCFEIIQQCTELRSLKLIGETKWITSMVRQISQTLCKLQQLTIVISGIGSVSKILTFVASIFSLRRLEICADDFVEDRNAFCSVMTSSKIEQFIMSSCSIIDWNELSYILPHFIDIHLLSVSLIDNHQKSIPSFIFHGFVIDQRWTYLLESAPNSIRIFVNVFLQQDTHSYFCEKIKAALDTFDLNLTCSEDDTDCSLYHENMNRWWNLRGIIIKR